MNIIQKLKQMTDKLPTFYIIDQKKSLDSTKVFAHHKIKGISDDTPEFVWVKNDWEPV